MVMVPSGVAPEDVEKELGRSLTPAELEQAQQWIADAEMLINARLGPERMATIDMDLYGFVVRQAVVRRFQQASVGGASSRTVSVDDASVTDRYDGVRHAYWWFLPEWWELLNPAAESSAFSTRPKYESGWGEGPNWWGYEVGNWPGPWIG